MEEKKLQIRPFDLRDKEFLESKIRRLEFEKIEMKANLEMLYSFWKQANYRSVDTKRQLELAQQQIASQNEKIAALEQTVVMLESQVSQLAGQE